MKCQQPNLFGQVTKPAAGEEFCSGASPCKHINDGSCIAKSAYTNAFMAPVAAATGSCSATALWKNAEPTKEKGWFFVTDDESTAMDKWCVVHHI